MKKNEDRDKAKKMYQQFVDEFPYCMICLWSLRDRRRNWHFAKLDVAHIVGGSGRIADRRAIVMLCAGCHRLSHLDTIKITEGGETIRIPNLRAENLVWAKSIHDPENYDLEYLKSLRYRSDAPDPEQPDEWHLKAACKNVERRNLPWTIKQMYDDFARKIM